MLKLELELAVKEYDAKHPDSFEPPKYNSKGEPIFKHTSIHIFMLKDYLKHLNFLGNDECINLKDFYEFIERKYFKANCKDHVVASEIFNEDFFNGESDDATIFRRLKKADDVFDGLKNVHASAITKMSSLFQTLSSAKIGIVEDKQDQENPRPSS